MNWAQVTEFNLDNVRADKQWTTPATENVIETTIKALAKNGIDAELAKDGQDAKARVLKLIPKGAEVMTMTSQTLEELGINQEINESGEYEAVKVNLMKMNRETQAVEMQKLGAAPEWAIGSVHAVTLDGKVLIASNSGSQIPGYSYGASHVIWIVGAQKIVKNMDEGLNRIYKHTLPLEAERASLAYGVPGSFVSKLLIINQELVVGRIKMVIIPEKIGF